ncbi:hypothetical protein GGS20DRAFT_573662 [Poronia punctata]|nr:hypothetical protein GGS20DRAFT_573662 [Poronia punctata]
MLEISDLSTTLILNARDSQPFPHGINTEFGDENHAVRKLGGTAPNLTLGDEYDLAERLSPPENLDDAKGFYEELGVP